MKLEDEDYNILLDERAGRFELDGVVWILEKECVLVPTPISNYPHLRKCSICGWASENWTRKRFAYCPGCGAKVVE